MMKQNLSYFGFKSLAYQQCTISQQQASKQAGSSKMLIFLLSRLFDWICLFCNGFESDQQQQQRPLRGSTKH